MAKRATAPGKPKAIGYTRVSTGKQAENGGSLAVQRDRIVEYAVLNGFDLVSVFEDAGVSGAADEGERPGFRNALNAVRAGEAEALIVTDADRFSRDADIAGHARVEVKRAGGMVLVISEAAASVETVAVRQLLAVLEREKIRARMRTWSAARLAKGLRMGPAPFGYALGPDGHLKEVEAERPVLERIRALREAGEPLRTIAATLNAEGVPTRSGRPWNPMTIDSIVKRPDRA